MRYLPFLVFLVSLPFVLVSCGLDPCRVDSIHPLAQAWSPEGPLLAEGASDRRREGEAIRPSSRPHRSRHDARVAWIYRSTSDNINGNIDGDTNGTLNGNTNDSVNGSTHVVGGVSPPSMQADDGRCKQKGEGNGRSGCAGWE